MKKAVLSLLLCFTLCACSSGEITPCLKGISFTAEMTYYNESYCFDGSISTQGELTAVITSPEELKDLKLILGEKGTTVEYKGITYTPVEGTMPFSAVLKNFYNPIREVMAEELLADGDGKLKTGEGTEAAVFVFSPTGLPQTMEHRGKGFSVNFYNVSIISA